MVPFSLEDEFSKTSIYTKADDWHSHSVVGEYAHIYMYIHVVDEYVHIYVCTCVCVYTHIRL